MRGLCLASRRAAPSANCRHVFIRDARLKQPSLSLVRPLHAEPEAATATAPDAPAAAVPDALTQDAVSVEDPPIVEDSVATAEAVDAASDSAAEAPDATEAPAAAEPTAAAASEAEASASEEVSDEAASSSGGAPKSEPAVYTRAQPATPPAKPKKGNKPQRPGGRQQLPSVKVDASEFPYSVGDTVIGKVRWANNRGARIDIEGFSAVQGCAPQLSSLTCMINVF